MIIWLIAMSFTIEYVVQTPAENGNGVSSFLKTQWANWQPQNQIPMLESSTAMGYV